MLPHLCTAAVQQSMPDFHARLESRLRTPAQGADTIVWLCIAKGMTNGAFYQGTLIMIYLYCVRVAIGIVYALLIVLTTPLVN